MSSPLGTIPLDAKKEINELHSYRFSLFAFLFQSPLWWCWSLGSIHLKFIIARSSTAFTEVIELGLTIQLCERGDKTLKRMPLHMTISLMNIVRAASWRNLGAQDGGSFPADVSRFDGAPFFRLWRRFLYENSPHTSPLDWWPSNQIASHWQRENSQNIARGSKWNLPKWVYSNDQAAKAIFQTEMLAI